MFQVATTVTSTIRMEDEVAIKVTIGETITLAEMVATVAMTATVEATTLAMVKMAVDTSAATVVRIVIITVGVTIIVAAIATEMADSGHATEWIAVAVEWMLMVAPGMEWTTTAEVAVVAIEGTRETTTGWVTKVSRKGECYFYICRAGCRTLFKTWSLKSLIFNEEFQ